MLQRSRLHTALDTRSRLALVVLASIALVGCGGDDTTLATDSGSDAPSQTDAPASHADATAPDASNGGGDASDAGAEVGPLVYLDAGSACRPDAAHGGDRWQDLYACYFGATGVAGCGTMMNCHSSPDDFGTLSSSGFYCDATDAGSCWQTVNGLLVTDAGPADPTSTTLYAALRKTDGTGSMPLLPTTVVFQSGDMARITSWIAAGAPNN